MVYLVIYTQDTVPYRALDTLSVKSKQFSLAVGSLK